MIKQQVVIPGTKIRVVINDAEVDSLDALAVALVNGGRGSGAFNAPPFETMPVVEQRAWRSAAYAVASLSSDFPVPSVEDLKSRQSTRAQDMETKEDFEKRVRDHAEKQAEKAHHERNLAALRVSGIEQAETALREALQAYRGALRDIETEISDKREAGPVVASKLPENSPLTD